MPEITDKAREEFFSEAQEIIETLSRNLLSLDTASKHGSHDPSLINEAFRAVHTLKGLAGLFGAVRLGALSHRLEDLLDALRLGRLQILPQTLDVLFSAVDIYNKVLEVEKSQKDEHLPEVDELLAALERLGAGVPQVSSPMSDYEFDSGMLAVLTEYEEHRLKVNIEQRMSLYRLRVQFDLATIDRALEQIKEKARRHGEIITYLPTGETTSADSIELDLLMASRDTLSTLVGSMGADNVIIEEISRKRRGSDSEPVRTSIHRPSVSLVASELAPDRGSDSISPAPRETDRSGAMDKDRSLRSLTQTVRVDIRKLDHLMNIVGELAIVRGALARIAERVRNDGQRRLSTELLRLHRNFDRRLSEMQDGILEVRMVPLGQVFERLARVVRQISRELGKEIRLVITGAETEIDKLIVEELSDPLMHMIRNAIDHGIEVTERRAEVGKPSAGTIALNAYQKGNHVMIEVEDDGRGIDERGIVDKAVSLGKIDAHEVDELSREDVLGLIFLPGLSTRSLADDVSGRGVGMDIVKTNISKLGGVIDVHSESGIGTKMTITLPITLAIVSALIVRAEEQIFALPLASVSEALSLDEASVRVIDGREVVTLRGSTLPICRLSRLLELERQALAGQRMGFVVVIALGHRRLGLVVDHLFGQQDIVIKPLGRSLAGVRGFAGATELGDQRVGLVLDAAALIEEVLSSGEAQRERPGARYA